MTYHIHMSSPRKMVISLAGFSSQLRFSRSNGLANKKNGGYEVNISALLFLDLADIALSSRGFCRVVKQEESGTRYSGW